MAQSLQLTCPVCQHSQAFRYHNRLNAQRDDQQLKQQLLNGELFRFECEQCGAKRQLDTQFLYHDPEKKFMVFLLPEYRHDNDEINRILDDILMTQPFSLNDYNLRIALHGTDLVEKIHIFDAGYDDREIELLKLLTDGMFAQEKPTTPVKGRYFYLHNGKPKFLYITDSEQILVDFHEKLLEFVRTKLAKSLTTDIRGDFHLIHHAWAMSQLDKKESAES